MVPAPRTATAFTWFAGYAWRIAACARCGAHLGWRFEPAGGEGAPFWGLLVRQVVWVPGAAA